MAQDLEALIRRWFEEVWNQECMETCERTIDDMMTLDAVVHGLGTQSAADFKQFRSILRASFPDIQCQLNPIVSDGKDLVAARWEMNATHKGDGFGVKASNQPVQVTGMVIIRFRDGRLAEAWNNFDELGMLRQIGAIPE